MSLSKRDRSDLLRLMEVIQGYENLIEEYSKIDIYNPRMNYNKAVEKYKLYLINSAIEYFHGNKETAARNMQMNKKTLFNIIERNKK